MDKKLQEIEELLSRLWGHLAVAKETRHKIYKEGYKCGYRSGYRYGKKDGIELGYEEGQHFLAHQPPDPLARKKK